MSWTTSNPYSHHYDIPSQHIPKAMMLTKHRLKLLTQMIISSCKLFLRYLSPWQKVWLTHQATQKRVVITSDIWAWSWREHPFICVTYKFCSSLSEVIWKSGVRIMLFLLCCLLLSSCDSEFIDTGFNIICEKYLVMQSSLASNLGLFYLTPWSAGRPGMWHG